MLRLIAAVEPAKPPRRKKRDQKRARTAGKNVVKVIVVPGRTVNLVVK